MRESNDGEMAPWHQLFGLFLADFFSGTTFDVDMEVDLSTKRQLLDVVVLRRRERPPPDELPDGFDLTDFNLLTFKSLHEPLGAWAIKELIGHYVNYRKQVDPSTSDLLPEERFRLFAVCARFPEKLSQQTSLDEAQPGVYNLTWGVDWVIVLSQVPAAEHNAIFNLFSAQESEIRYGGVHFPQRASETSTLKHRIAGGDPSAN